MKEIRKPEELDLSRIRIVGGGRKQIEEVYPGITETLRQILDESTSGSPMSPMG